MRRTISIWWVIAFVAIVLVAFFSFSSKLSDEIATMQSMLDNEKILLSQAEAEKAELDAELKTAGTDAYIENEARNEYGFMMRDEMRFIISNPHSTSDDQKAGMP